MKEICVTMAILERLGTILKSNVNAILDKCEDPAKMVDQLLLDSRENLAKVRSSTAEVMAVEKNAKRLLDECDDNIARYTTAAQNAVRSGADGDARKLLTKKQSFEARRPDLEKNYQVAHKNAEDMRAAHDKLVADISYLEGQKDIVKAKMATAAAQQSVNKAVTGMKSDTSVSAFERMSAKADAALDKARAEAELAAGDTCAEDLAAKYSSGAGGGSVEDELARMKAELGQA